MTMWKQSCYWNTAREKDVQYQEDYLEAAPFIMHIHVGVPCFTPLTPQSRSLGGGNTVVQKAPLSGEPKLKLPSHW